MANVPLACNPSKQHGWRKGTVTKQPKALSVKVTQEARVCPSQWEVLIAWVQRGICFSHSCTQLDRTIIMMSYWLSFPPSKNTTTRSKSKNRKKVKPKRKLLRGLAVWLSGHLTVWPSNCLAVQMSGCLTVWLSNCLNVWLSDCLAIWLYGWPWWWHHLPQCCWVRTALWDYCTRHGLRSRCLLAGGDSGPNPLEMTHQVTQIRHPISRKTVFQSMFNCMFILGCAQTLDSLSFLDFWYFFSFSSVIFGSFPHTVLCMASQIFRRPLMWSSLLLLLMSPCVALRKAPSSVTL